MPEDVQQLAFLEALIAITLPPNLPIPVVELREVKRITAQTEEAYYLMWHWPWSRPGDIASHMLMSLN